MAFAIHEPRDDEEDVGGEEEEHGASASDGGEADEDDEGGEGAADAELDVDADARLAAELQAQITAPRGSGLRERRQVQYSGERVDNWAEVERAKTKRAPPARKQPAARGAAPARRKSPARRGGRGEGSDDDGESDESDGDDDDDDDDWGGGDRRRSRKPRKPSARAGRMSAADVRRSGRAGGGVSYADGGNDEDIYYSDEQSDEEARVAAAAAAKLPSSLSERKLLNLGLSAAPPQVEKLLASREAVGGGLEFLVKWKGRAHVHAGWASEADVLAEKGGQARVTRFDARQRLCADEEPIEPQFLEVERIVAQAFGPYGRERAQARVFLVKWRSLPYAACTWEHGSSIDDDDAVARFEAREKPPGEKRMRKHVLGRQQVRPWAEAKASPEYRGGNTLRAYQLEGLNWLSFSWHEGRNVILADEMGLGKTVQSVSLLHYLYTQQQCRGPFLVVAPLSCVPHWTREVEAWTDLDCVLYHGDKESRAAIQEFEWRYARGLGADELFKFNVVVTTFEMILEKEAALKAIHWNALVVDEAHRLKNASSRLSQVLSSYSVDHTVLLTGTPLQNSKEELFTLLNFVAPAEFPSTDNFERRFGALDSAAAVGRLNESIKPFLLRRMKADVEKSVPPKEETIVEVELTQLQKQYYRAIYEKNTGFLNRGAKGGNTVNLMNVMMELRKCCNHPFLVNGVEDKLAAVQRIDRADEREVFRLLTEASGKLTLMDKLLPKLHAGGHKVLVFSQMVRCLDILEDYLKHKRYAYERLDGNVRGNDRQSAIDRFSKKGSDRFVFLLCTRAGGLGINLTAADTVIIYDSDWNPQNDIQAQARCHRIGQTQAVKVYRLITRNTYEMQMFRKASLKLGLDHAVLGGMERGGGGGVGAAGSGVDGAGGRGDKLSAKEIDALLKHGAYHVFTEDDGAADEAAARFNEQDIDTILERSTHVKQYSSLAEAGSTFSKATFVSSGGAGMRDVNVDDDDFWEKIGLKPQEEVVEALGDRQRRAVARFGMEAKPERDDFEDSGPESDGGGSEAGGPRGERGSRSTGTWSKKARDLFIGGMLRFGPTRARRSELNTPTPGHEGTCYGKPAADQRAVASGFTALCLKCAGATVADYAYAKLVVDPAATTEGTDAVMREPIFRERVARNAAAYLDKMETACELHELVRGSLAAEGGPLDDEPPVYAREGVIAFRIAQGASAEEAAAAEAAAAADPTDEVAATAEDEARIAYTQRVRRLAAIRVPTNAPGRTLPCAGWGPSEDRMLLLGVWLYGLNGYEQVKRDSVLAKVARLPLYDAEEEGGAAREMPAGAVQWPSRDALDRRFRALLKAWSGKEARGTDGGGGGGGRAKAEREPAAARKPAAAKPKPQAADRRMSGAAPAKLPPRAAASAARERITAGGDDDGEQGREAPARVRAGAAPARAPPAAPAGPPPDPELKKAVTSAMLKYGDLSARDAPSSAHGRGLEDAVAAELGRRADAEASELERTAQLVRAEWERLVKSDDRDKAKKAQGKLTRLALCNSVRALANAPPRAPLAVGKDESLPVWWQPSAHDVALVRGIAQHGFNCYEAVFADRALFAGIPAADVVPGKALQEALFKRIRRLVERPAAGKPGAAPRAGAGPGAPAKRPPASARTPGVPPRLAAATGPALARAHGAQSRAAAAPPEPPRASQPFSAALAAPAPPKKQLARDWAGGGGGSASGGAGGGGGSAAGVRPAGQPPPAPPAGAPVGAKRTAEPSAEQLPPFKKQFQAR